MEQTKIGTCSKEPQFGDRVVYGYFYPKKCYMCSICRELLPIDSPKLRDRK